MEISLLEELAYVFKVLKANYNKPFTKYEPDSALDRLLGADRVYSCARIIELYIKENTTIETSGSAVT